MQPREVALVAPLEYAYLGHAGSAAASVADNDRSASVGEATAAPLRSCAPAAGIVECVKVLLPPLPSFRRCCLE